MWFMFLLSCFAIIVQLFFIVLSVAAGLYYLAELVEEYTVVASKVIRYMIFITLGIYIGLLLFENLPHSLIFCGIGSQLMHLLILRNFPFFNLTSPPFMAAVVLLFVNHYLAFSHFATVYYPFTQVLGFFTLCLWIVPFAFFISLSANENTLPTHAEQRPLINDDQSDFASHYFSRKAKRYGLLSLFNLAKESILPQRIKKSF